MFSLLIAVIYLSFVSLGLPDSVLGAAWPAMHLEIGASVSAAGVVQMLISASTVVSALFSNRLTKKFGTGLVTGVSVLLTALAMLFFSFARSFPAVCLFALPYGLGAGAIDSALNNFAALHLSAKHMNWLHCCWGIGATLSPYLMGVCLAGEKGWRGGYQTVSLIQFCMTAVVLCSLPLWRKFCTAEAKEEKTPDSKPLTVWQVLRYPGAAYAFFGFLLYCLMEVLPMVWASTYFYTVYGVNEDASAYFASFIMLGMAASRILCGFLSTKCSDRFLIRAGLFTVILSAVLLLIPFSDYLPALLAFFLFNFGCGPVFPAFVHRVPADFGKQHSGEIIGVQLAFAYAGFTFSALIFGKIVDLTSIKALPFVILFYAGICLFLSEKLNRFLKKKNG